MENTLNRGPKYKLDESGVLTIVSVPGEPERVKWAKPAYVTVSILHKIAIAALGVCLLIGCYSYNFGDTGLTEEQQAHFEALTNDYPDKTIMHEAQKGFEHIAFPEETISNPSMFVAKKFEELFFGAVSDDEPKTADEGTNLESGEK